MSWRYNSDDSKSIDDLVSWIITELKDTGGWTEVDSGYDVLQNPDGDFDVYFSLEASDKRYIQVEIGEAGTWNTSTHSMDTPKISFGIVLYDGASATGSDTGLVKMGYDDDYCYIMTDYKSAGANYRRCFAYIGLAHAYASGDTCLVGGSTLFRGSTTAPTNDATGAMTIKMMKDVSGSATKPTYTPATVCVATSGNTPRGQLNAAKQGYRYFIPIWLRSNSSYPSGGENAGIRARLNEVYAAFNEDSEAHGETIKLSNSTKEYMYFIQADTTSYTHLFGRLLFRVV